MLRIVVVYPELLGTYGDGGNALVLARRAQWRGIEAEVLLAPSDRSVPVAELYCLGGGEDAPQVLAAQALAADTNFAGAVGDGAVVLAVCAGFQIAGLTFPDATGAACPGVGLVPVVTAKGSGRRAVGEVVAEATEPSLGRLSGFENHSGLTSIADASVVPLARVSVGTGNGDGSGFEGVRAARFIGTYLHGPVLARNPALADALLAEALGGVQLDPLDDTVHDRLRAERFAALR